MTATDVSSEATGAVAATRLLLMARDLHKPKAVDSEGMAETQSVSCGVAVLMVHDTWVQKTKTVGAPSGAASNVRSTLGKVTSDSQTA